MAFRGIYEPKKWKWLSEVEKEKQKQKWEDEIIEPGVVVHGCNPNMRKTEAGRPLLLQG